MERSNKKLGGSFCMQNPRVQEVEHLVDLFSNRSEVIFMVLDPEPKEFEGLILSEI